MIALAALTAMIGGVFPALAWQSDIDGPRCTLTHSDDQAEVRLTYDPATPLYAITITRGTPWPDAPIFAMRFGDAQPNTITTNRHVLSDDGLSLTVTDRGFGNVLDGLQFNQQAVAISGAASVTLDLSGAAPEVEAFRLCETAPLA